MTTLEIRLPTDQYRSMPIPGHTYKGKPSKIATCFVRATDIPPELGDWMDVNPRMPARKRDRQELAGRVARRIVKTLQDTPDLFALKNQGIHVLVDGAEFTNEKGGVGILTLRLTDKSRHGIPNGGHTFFAIREAVEDDESDPPEDAWVRLHVLEHVDPEHITELAEGLNRSLQVDDASLHNLEGKFDLIKDALDGKAGADQISYKMGEPGSVDIQDVLSYMAALNPSLFPGDNGKQPNSIFGQPAKVLKYFVDEEDGDGGGFSTMLPHLHEILVLWERVLEECARYSTSQPRLALLNRRKGKENQKKSPRPALFAAGRTIDRRVFSGLVYPIFAAFRANVSEKDWKKGKMSWVVDPELLLEETIDQLCAVIRTAYTDNRSDPAVVGKKQAAYLACYQVVLLKLARMGKLSS
ncbi:AIPR family protein [Methylobacterium indicum]|uniref:AIPR family protein n=1 Tax=Methylobacterium indicum TaxID=1775910 RepID=UPI0009EBDA17|nr:AIPR family protein [Methylobacterium indicum]